MQVKRKILAAAMVGAGLIGTSHTLAQTTPHTNTADCPPVKTMCEMPKPTQKAKKPKKPKATKRTAAHKT